MHNSERLVVITGGTKGIGKALVDRFASEGWPVATCSRNESDLDALRGEISEKHKTLIHTFKADLSKKEGVKDFVEFVQMIAKPVEILVNNTGVFNPGPVLEEADGALEQMIDTNLYSAYHLTRAIVPAMKQNKSGHIFNLCSVASLKAYPNGGSYSISKFALYGFSQAIREELKEFGVRVTSILAGAVRTPSWDGVDIPDERFMKPEDIAETIYTSYRLSERSVIEDVVLRPQLGDI
ncbi:Short-chain dehydrogenase [Ekhidna lutea]|uniref:Short-chain dehydrogenase n=1 Tax=Ekhidna lutea TaxID=447679 RepID=A0A239HAJ0_EKHLU|nr:SDR family oxidoreductase [Ekhidna lutea]SNS78380.1 Short-chain dehydrogenase [Ekhidna lutea]